MSGGGGGVFSKYIISGSELDNIGLCKIVIYQHVIQF